MASWVALRLSTPLSKPDGSNSLAIDAVRSVALMLALWTRAHACGLSWHGVAGTSMEISSSPSKLTSKCGSEKDGVMAQDAPRLRIAAAKPPQSGIVELKLTLLPGSQ